PGCWERLQHFHPDSLLPRQWWRRLLRWTVVECRRHGLEQSLKRLARRIEREREGGRGRRAPEWPTVTERAESKTWWHNQSVSTVVRRAYQGLYRPDDWRPGAPTLKLTELERPPTG